MVKFTGNSMNCWNISQSHIHKHSWCSCFVQVFQGCWQCLADCFCSYWQIYWYGLYLHASLVGCCTYCGL